MNFDETFGILLILLCIGVAFSFICCLVKFYSFCFTGNSTSIKPIDTNQRRNNLALSYYYYPNGSPYGYPYGNYPGQNIDTGNWPSHFLRQPAVTTHVQLSQNYVLPINCNELRQFEYVPNQDQNRFGILRRAQTEYVTRSTAEPSINIDNFATVDTVLETVNEQLPPSYEEVMKKKNRYPKNRSISEAAVHHV